MAIGQATAEATSSSWWRRRAWIPTASVRCRSCEYAFGPSSSASRSAIHGDGTWCYDEDTVLQIVGQDEPFHHTDRNTLTKIGEPVPNPLARR